MKKIKCETVQEEFKSYQKVQKWLENVIISKEEIINSPIYKFLLTYLEKINKNPNQTDNIYLANITSMCVKNRPTDVRVRSDKFLIAAREDKLSLLLAGYQLKTKKIVIILPSACLKLYPFKLDKSNSFFTFSKEDMENKFYFNNSDTLNIDFKKSVKINGKVKPRVYFYATTLDTYNENQLIEFLELVNNRDYSQDINKFEKLISKTLPPIPIEIREERRRFYNNLCLTSKVNLTIIEPENMTCPCGEAINLKYLEENNLSYTDIHHLVPKEYFLKNTVGTLDWNIIHSKENLVPLCSACHQAVHKGIKHKELVRKTFESIVLALEQKWITDLKTTEYNLFLDFLTKNTSFNSLEALVNEFYLGEKWKE